MKIPRISIIIPVFNTEKYLSKCIASVIDQTYTNLEIILVNDGSVDRSLDICKAYAMNDSRVVVVNKLNGGVSAARNMGLDIASGAYIGFIDSDDFIDTGMYEELLLAIRENDADIAECGYYTTDFKNKINGQYPLKKSIDIGSYQCSRNYLAGINTTNFNVNKLYKKSIFNDIRYTAFAYSEDYALNVKAFYKCKKKVTINGCYYYYLQNDESACNRPFTELKLDVIIAKKEMFDFLQDKYPDLCQFIALNISESIIGVYKD